MELNRRQLFGVALAPVVTRLGAFGYFPIAVMEDLREKGIIFTTRYFPDKKTSLVTSITIEGVVCQNLEFTIERRGRRITPVGRYISAETFLIIPELHTQWVSDGIRVL